MSVVDQALETQLKNIQTRSGNYGCGAFYGNQRQVQPRQAVQDAVDRGKIGQRAEQQRRIAFLPDLHFIEPILPAG